MSDLIMFSELFDYLFSSVEPLFNIILACSCILFVCSLILIIISFISLRRR